MIFSDSMTTRHTLFSLNYRYHTILSLMPQVYMATNQYICSPRLQPAHTQCARCVWLNRQNCYTEYYASMSGGSLTSYCGDGPLIYHYSQLEAPNGVWEKDWKDVGSAWGLGLSLNSGITDGNSAISRLLSQMIPTTTDLDPELPSISEALAVLAGCTLVLSSQSSPFIHCKSPVRVSLSVRDDCDKCCKYNPNSPEMPRKYNCSLYTGKLTRKCTRLELHDTGKNPH